MIYRLRTFYVLVAFLIYSILAAVATFGNYAIISQVVEDYNNSMELQKITNHIFDEN
jgi:hypothetical protein